MPGEAARLEADILRVRADRIAWLHQLEEAIHAELRALGLLDAARAAQDTAREHVHGDTLEIDRLLDEIPRQRPASE